MPVCSRDPREQPGGPPPGRTDTVRRPGGRGDVTHRPPRHFRSAHHRHRRRRLRQIAARHRHRPRRRRQTPRDRRLRRRARLRDTQRRLSATTGVVRPAHARDGDALPVQLVQQPRAAAVVRVRQRRSGDVT